MFIFYRFKYNNNLLHTNVHNKTNFDLLKNLEHKF